MRGTRAIRAVHIPEPGIIPAYAGNTWNLRRSRTESRDHPRVCGEHEGIARDAKAGTGSSPRMRGTRIVFDWTVYDPGIIPAYAGNTKMSGLVT